MSLIEPLESRIAPAALLKNVLSYTDIDGDLVTIKFGAHGTVQSSEFTFDTAFDTTGPQKLQAIDFTADPHLSGASVTMKVTIPGGGAGDGLADVGSISGTRFGNITILGDVGNFDLGGDLKHSSAGKIAVHSLGKQIVTAQVSPLSTFAGNVASLTVATDVDRAFLTFDGKLGALTIKGNLIGAPDGTGLANGPNNTGEIVVDHNVGKVLIGGDVQGGGGDFSGYLELDGTTGSVTVTGSVLGGAGFNAGSIQGADLGKFTLVHNLSGGGGNDAGLIGFDSIGVILVQGDVIGGGGDDSGQVFSGDDTSSATILGDIRGGGGQYSGYLDIEGVSKSVTLGKKNAVSGGNLIGGVGIQSGVLFFAEKAASINIYGSITAGTQSLSGAIDADSAIGTIHVHGGIQGSVSAAGYVPVSITAFQQVGAKAKSDLTIKSLTIDGDAVGLLVRAGYNDDTALDPDAQIGAVTIGGSFSATSIIAGVTDGLNDGFGNANDAVISAVDPYLDRPKVYASIASITLKGANGGNAGSALQFGFEAQYIGKVTFDGHALHLLSKPGNDHSIPLDNTQEVVNEVPIPAVV